MLKYFLLTCAGVNRSVLDACSTETNKYVGIGGTVVMTASLAALSGGYAFHVVFANPLVAAGFGMLYGVFIGNLDRLIISSMRRQKKMGHELIVAVPRLLLSAAIALVVSKPLELRIFASEIDLKMEATLQTDLARHREWLEHSPTFSQNLQDLNKDIREANDTLVPVKTERDMRYRDMIQEAEGTAGSGHKGKGPLYQEKRQEFLNAEKQFQTARVMAKTRVAQDESGIAIMRQDQRRQQDEFARKEAQAVTLLAQIEALAALSQERSAVRAASNAILLLFLMLEMSPVLVKLLLSLSGKSLYDDTLEAFETDNLNAQNHANALREETRKKERGIAVDKAAAEQLGSRQITTKTADIIAMLAGAQLDEYARVMMERVPATMAGWFRQNAPQTTFNAQTAPPQANTPASPQTAPSTAPPSHSYAAPHITVMQPTQQAQHVTNSRHSSP